MPLVVSSLKSSLQNDWLPSEDTFADSASESGDKFASAFANWFSGAMAGGSSCSTAMARKSQLASAAGAAFSAQSATGAGNQLALGIALYILGQSFGPGVASMPLAMSAGGAIFGATFADLKSSLADRAQQFASGSLIIAVSTIVVFPPPTPPAPVS